MKKKKPLPPSIDLVSLFSRQLIFVSGKGGTGKTTLAVFLAQMAAKQGKQVLLCHINRLANEQWETNYLATYPQLSQMVITPNNSFKEYVLLKLKSEKLYQIFVEHSTALDILRRAAPALNELLVLGKVYWECRQKSFWFTPKWDHVIVDLPSTGHAATLLNIPSVVLEIFSKGIVAHETVKVKQLIANPKRTCLVTACLPEFMVVQETLSFMQLVERELHVALGPVFLNKVPSPPLSSGTAPLYEHHRDRISPNVQRLTDFFHNRFTVAEEHVAQFSQQHSKPLYTLPMVYGGVTNPEFYHLLETQLMEHWIHAQRG